MTFTSYTKIAASLITAAGLFAFTHFKAGSITGTVSPADAAVRAWAESVSDTLKTPVVAGHFEIPNARPGTYKIIIEARPPYRNVAKDGVLVNDGQPTDAGEIKLEK